MIKKTKLMCDRCGKVWNVKSTSIIEAKWNSMVLQYFLCPKCKNLYRIGLRDGKWFELFEDLKESNRRLDAVKSGRIKDEQTIRGLVGACETKKLRLQYYDKMLQSKYPGKFVVEKTGSIIYLP